MAPLILLSALYSMAPASPQTPSPPTKVDIDIARVAYFKGAVSKNGTVHCNRIRALQCIRTRSSAFICRYREWSESSWRPMKIGLEWRADQWEWASGDFPRCSITIIE